MTPAAVAAFHLPWCFLVRGQSSTSSALHWSTSQRNPWRLSCLFMADPGVTPTGTRLTTPSCCLPQALWPIREGWCCHPQRHTLPSHLELSPPSCHCLRFQCLKWVQQLSFRWWCAEPPKRKYSPTSLDAAWQFPSSFRGRIRWSCSETLLHQQSKTHLLGSLTISSLHVQCIVLPFHFVWDNCVRDEVKCKFVIRSSVSSFNASLPSTLNNWPVTSRARCPLARWWSHPCHR